MKQKQGWTLSKSDLIEQTSETEIINIILSFFNTKHSKTSSYKFVLFKSILDNLFNMSDDLSISFYDLNYTFAKVYWNIIVKHKLPQIMPNSQFKQSYMERYIYELIEEHQEYEVDFDSLRIEIKDSYVKYSLKVLTKDVLGALASELQFKVFSFNKDKSIYSIKLSRISSETLMQYKAILEKLNYYHWIIWIESVLNKLQREDGNIATKLDYSTQRKSLRCFHKELLVGDLDNVCFYCGKKLKLDKVHLDHFIPWSFCKDDKIWNLVISCSNCNLKKSNKILCEYYLEKIKERNIKLFKQSYSQKLDRLYYSSIANGYIKIQEFIRCSTQNDNGNN